MISPGARPAFQCVRKEAPPELINFVWITRSRSAAIAAIKPGKSFRCVKLLPMKRILIAAGFFNLGKDDHAAGHCQLLVPARYSSVETSFAYPKPSAAMN